MAELTEVEVGLIANGFADDMRSGLLIAQSLSTSHFSQAEKWISSRKTGLRTLDALHLACAWSFEAEMITGDKILHQSAKALGIQSRLF
jgi:uncharacterized protein